MNGFIEKTFEGFGSNLNLHYCGKRLNNFGHHYGPYNLDTYLIYYIKEGKATLTCNGQNMELTGKSFFVNFPYSQNEYTSVQTQPWSIKWVVAEGAVIENYLSLLGITRKKPFVELKESQDIDMIFDEMFENFDRKALSSRIYCISLFHRLFSLLAKKIDALPSQNAYVAKALELIQIYHSDCNFNVTALSKMVGLHYNYLSVLFKKETGNSPIAYISEYRLDNACKMLKFTNNSIKDIAQKCGYADEFYFSRAFRKRFHQSPKQYRQNEAYMA